MRCPRNLIVLAIWSICAIYLFVYTAKQLPTDMEYGNNIQKTWVGIAVGIVVTSWLGCIFGICILLDFVAD